MNRQSPPPYFPLREQARKHLKNAGELLNGEGQQLIYACLELRLSIEALVYETLQTYAQTLSPEVTVAYQHWQPNKVLEFLREYDPLADQSLLIRVRRVGDDGGPEEGPAFFEGIDNRLSVKWVEKAHRSLGSFLHQRTISQLQNRTPIDEAKLKKEATRIIARLDEVLKSDVCNIRIAGGFQYRCERCGTALNIAMAALILHGFADVRCQNCSTSRRVEMESELASCVSLLSRMREHNHRRARPLPLMVACP
jgi:DNA-directed RNA polymerase subunit RPC12/RpoP